MTFYKSIHCAAQLHCKLCRSRIAGGRFRRSMLRLFPGLNVADFACPRDKDWIEDGKPVKRNLSITSVGKLRREGKKYNSVTAAIKLLPHDHPASVKYEETQQKLKQAANKDIRSRLIDRRRIRNQLVREWEHEYVLG